MPLEFHLENTEKKEEKKTYLNYDRNYDFIRLKP